MSSAEEGSFSQIPGIARFPSPGHDSEISSYLGSPSILHLPALHLSGTITTPPPRAPLGKRPAATAPRSLWQEEEQVSDDPSKLLSTKTLVKYVSYSLTFQDCIALAEGSQRRSAPPRQAGPAPTTPVAPTQSPAEQGQIEHERKQERKRREVQVTNCQFQIISFSTLGTVLP